MDNNSHGPYPDRRKVGEAFDRWHGGDTGSDEKAASDLLYLYNVQKGNVTNLDGTVSRGLVKNAEQIAVSWMQKAISAAVDDPDFFTRIARILKKWKTYPKRNEAIPFIYLAYLGLTKDPLHNPEEVTKKKVQAIAEQIWAFKNLVDRNIFRGMLWSDELALTPTQKALLQEEIAALRRRLTPDQWKKFWPILALENLPKAKRGPNSIQ